VCDVFGHLPDGAPVEKVTLRGSGGFEIAIITLGAAVQALRVPDREGRCADVVLGHDALAPYLAHRRFFGATIGRYANRIAGGRFELDGQRIQLPLNDGPNTLHGGPDGFDRRLWRIETADFDPAPSVTLSYASPEGEGGFPGALSARITFALTGDTGFSLMFEAVTDRPTIVNLTNHNFFNLAGAERGTDVLDHRLVIEADSFLPTDADAIPLEPQPVAGTPFDFTQPRLIGERIRDAHEQLRLRRGYDHNFCLPGGRTETPRPVARVEHPASGRAMTLSTNQPGLQFYSGNFLDGSAAGKGGRLYRQYDAFCLEPQIWPDAPNRPDFPSARLSPNETYRHVSVFEFSTV
jgi:aldose 1-epimerase